MLSLKVLGGVLSKSTAGVVSLRRGVTSIVFREIATAMGPTHRGQEGGNLGLAAHSPICWTSNFLGLENHFSGFTFFFVAIHLGSELGFDREVSCVGIVSFSRAGVAERSHQLPFASSSALEWCGQGTTVQWVLSGKCWNFRLVGPTQHTKHIIRWLSGGKFIAKVHPTCNQSEPTGSDN